MKEIVSDVFVRRFAMRRRNKYLSKKLRALFDKIAAVDMFSNDYFYCTCIFSYFTIRNTITSEFYLHFGNFIEQYIGEILFTLLELAYSCG